MRLKVTLLIICVVALGVRLGLIWNSIGIPGNYGLAVWHGEAARNLVEGRGFVVDKAYLSDMIAKIDKANYLIDIEDIAPPSNEKFEEVYQITPGLPALIASTYFVFGEYRYIYVRILQALIDTFGCFVIFLLGRELFNKRVGLISAGIYALFLPIAFLATMVIHDAIMPFLVLTSLYLFVMGAKKGSIKYYVLSAVVVSISCYFQPSALFLPIMYGMGLFVYSIRKTGFCAKLWNVIKVTVIMVAVMVVIAVPWIVRNHQITNRWSPNLRVGTWAGIWEGVGEFVDNPIGAKLEDNYALEIARQELGYDVEYGSIEFDAVFKPKVLNLIKEHPGWYVGMMLRRIPKTIVYVNGLGIEEHSPEGMSWGGWEDSKVLWSEYIPAIRQGNLLNLVIKNPYALFYWAIVALFALIPPILALMGIWVVRKKWRTVALILTVPIYLASVHMITFVSGCGKTLLPTSIIYIIMSAAFIVFCCEWIKKRRAI